MKRLPVRKILYDVKFSICIVLAGFVGAAFVLVPAKSEHPFGLPGFSIAEDHVFIRYQQNELKFYGNPDGWNQFFGKLERSVFSGSEHVSIVHMGGSHVQAGTLTDRLRYNFSQMTNGIEAERGLVFPFKLAGTNSPTSIRSTWTGTWKGCRCAVSNDTCEWGMTGIVATTNDSMASLKMWIRKSDTTTYSFREVKVYTPTSPQQMYYTVQGAHDEMPSSTAGCRIFRFENLSDTLQIQVQKTDSSQHEFTLQGVYLGEKKEGITYNTIGVNGASTKSYLRCPMFFSQFSTLDADLVVFGIGVNDANVPVGEFDPTLYEQRYDSLIRGMRSINPNLQFIFLTNNDTYYLKKRPNANAIEVQKVMVRLAEKYDGAVWDLFEIMGGMGSIRAWQDAGLAKSDKIHFTEEGYQLQADLMYQAFLEAFGNYLDHKRVY